MISILRTGYQYFKNATTYGLLIFILPGFLKPAYGQQIMQPETLFISGKNNLPDWLQVENLSFSRLDGGYIEVQKAKRTKWGQGWKDEEYNVLENIYLFYADNIIKKLKMGGINVIWVTWSNGWSLEYEAGQRDNIKTFVDKCHQNNIKVLAYVCSSNIFWENMFLDYPVSVDIARKHSSGIPYTYHGENPLRFVANMNHPYWIKLEKRRVELALEAGIDGFFFDNPLSGNQPVENQVYFFNEIQKFIKEEKNRPDVPVTSNFGLEPQYQATNWQLDFVFNEFGRQPGVYNGQWVNGNVKKIKYIKSFLPPWKTAMHEANFFPGGLRERAFMPPKAQKLARAEAASFGAAYVNFIEGRLLTALIHNDKEAMKSWSAVGLYNNFLKTNAGYYAQTIQPHRTIVLIQDDAGFTFDSITGLAGRLLDFLSQNNILYNIKLEGKLKPEDLKETDLLILPGFLNTDRSTVDLIESFKTAGGKIIGFGGNQFIRDISDCYYTWSSIDELKDTSVNGEDLLKNIRVLSHNSYIEIKNAPNTLVNVTHQKNPNRTIIHLINYNDQPLKNVIVKVRMDSVNTSLKRSDIKALSPDMKDSIITDVKIDNPTIEFYITELDTYSIIVLN